MAYTGTDSCGNSPKNMFVARFEENLFNADRDALAEVVAEDCILQTVRPAGVETHTGTEAVLEALLSLRGTRSPTPEAGHLEAAITHGKAAAAWGYSIDGGRVQQFSHTFWFATLKAEKFAQIRVFQP